LGDKLEVLSGPGLVARYGEIAAWAGPQASAALQAHLVGEAQRTSQVPNGGDQFASSLIAVLQRGDPEPQAAFAVVGPGANGLTLFLHGPVQAWDSGRWLAPQPVPGWMVTSIGRPWPLIVLPYGATPPPQSQQGNPFDLVVGAVPGSGFVLLRPPTGPGQPAGAAPQVAAAPQPAGGNYGSAAVSPAGAGLGGPAEVGAAGVGAAGVGAGGVGAGEMGAAGALAGGGMAAAAGPAGVGPAGGGAVGTSPGAAGGAEGPALGAAALGAAALGTAAAGAAGTIAAGGGASTGGPEGALGAAPAAGAAVGEGAAAAGAAVGPEVAPLREAGGPLGQGSPGAGQVPAGGTVDLRNAFPPGRAPLPLASAWGIAGPSDLPEVPGVRCELGHFNHPRASHCFRCGRPILPGSPQQSAPRPPVGVLLADDGSIWSLSRGCLIGSEPGTAPEVQSGAAQGIPLRPGPNHAMAPVHAEIQLRVWSTFLLDRGAEGGTWLQGPDSQGWAQLGRNEQRELANGSHLSCGGRVLTYLSAWPA
jgi:hypothetical protein